jgi:hypothetical protein
VDVGGCVDAAKSYVSQFEIKPREYALVGSMATEAGCEIAKLANGAIVELSDGELGAPEVIPRSGAGETMFLIFFLRFFIVLAAMSISCTLSSW